MSIFPFPQAMSMAVHKREYLGLEAAELDASSASRGLAKWREAQVDFHRQTGLRIANNRSQVGGFGRSQAARATWQAKNYKKSHTNAKKSGIIKLTDGLLPQTADVNLGSLRGVVPKGVPATNVRVIAGYGTSTLLREAPRLNAQYGGDPNGWQKITGTVFGDYFKYECHWYENNGTTYPSEIKTIRIWKL